MGYEGSRDGIEKGYEWYRKDGEHVGVVAVDDDEVEQTEEYRREVNAQESLRAFREDFGRKLTKTERVNIVGSRYRGDTERADRVRKDLYYAEKELAEAESAAKNNCLAQRAARYTREIESCDTSIHFSAKFREMIQLGHATQIPDSPKLKRSLVALSARYQDILGSRQTEELITDCVLEAKMKYRPSRGAALETYVYLYVQSRLKNAVRDLKSKPTEVYVEDAVDGESMPTMHRTTSKGRYRESHTFDTGTSCSTEEIVLERLERAEQLRAILTTMKHWTDRDKDIVIAFYIRDVSDGVTATRWAMSCSAVRKRRSRLIGRITGCG
jgi:DNA-directed RNA polymerase specialized sigma24 family protein